MAAPVRVRPAAAVAAVPVAVAARSGVPRFGHIRLGRVIRATAIGSALAVSVVTVVFAGVIRLAPTGVAAGPAAIPARPCLASSRRTRGPRPRPRTAPSPAPNHRPPRSPA